MMKPGSGSDDDKMCLINDEHVVVIPPNSIPKPGPKLTVPRRIQLLLSRDFDDTLAFMSESRDRLLFAVPSCSPESFPCFPKSGPKPMVPGRVQLIIRHDSTVIMKDNTQKCLMLEFNGEEMSRSPADIVMVLDVSSGMEGERLSEVKRSMLFVMTKLSLIDRLSIITYSSEAKMLYSLCPVTSHSQMKLENLIKGLEAHGDGAVNIKRGLQMGLDVLKHRKYSSQRVGAIMLMSGSKENIDHGSIETLVLDGSVPVHTFGFGSDHDAKVQ